jgi:hypothetical protein
MHVVDGVDFKEGPNFMDLLECIKQVLQKFSMMPK